MKSCSWLNFEKNERCRRDRTDVRSSPSLCRAEIMLRIKKNHVSDIRHRKVNGKDSPKIMCPQNLYDKIFLWFSPRTSCRQPYLLFDLPLNSACFQCVCFESWPLMIENPHEMTSRCWIWERMSAVAVISEMPDHPQDLCSGLKKSWFPRN